MKTCTKCKMFKPLKSFSIDKQKKDGRCSRCKSCIDKRMRQWYKINREKANERTYQWSKMNRGKVNEQARRWYKANIEKVHAAKKVIRSTTRGKLNSSMGTTIGVSLKGNKAGRRWETLVGFTVEQLKRHLEKQFIEGMSWERYMKGEIHVDHKIPIAAFNFEKPEDIDFKRCWALKNLQPMWAHDNLSKGFKLIKPFQPALIF